MEIKRRLKKVVANFISLVGKGANNKIIIFKSGDYSDGLQYEKQVKIKKVDEEQHMVYGIVYSPDEIDSQGDIASAEVIKDMAYNFMRNARTNNVDQQHNFIGDEGFVAESWLLKQGDPVFPLEKNGSWAVGIKVEKEETWQHIKSGEITGLSLAGLAAVEEVTKFSTKNQILNTFYEKLKKYFSFRKDLNSTFDQTTVRDYLYALENVIDDILLSKSITGKKDAIMESIARSAEAMADMDISKPGSVIPTKSLLKLKTMLCEIRGLINQADLGQIDTNETDENKYNINKNAVNDGRNGETEMTSEELKKSIEDSIKPLSEKLDTLERINSDIVLRLEKVEKSTPGSRQAIKKERGNENQIPIWT